MPQLEARRSERIDYRADVELLARSSATPLAQSVLAHAHDLGPGGMRLTTDAVMPIGAEVMCRMTLDGRPAAFPGRVVWSREPHADAASNAHGMGICFESLGAYERALLRHVCERSSNGYRPVELHFAGIEQPVIARARAHAGGLRLSAALPIFTRGTELSFQLDEEGPHFSGRIGNAALLEENGTRRIEIDVDVDGVGEGSSDSDPVRFRRRARYGYPDEIEAEEQQELEAARGAVAVRPPTSPTLTTTTRRQARLSRAPLLPMFVAALVGGTLAWTAAWRFSDAGPLPQAEFVARPLAVSAEADVPELHATSAVAASPIAIPAPMPSTQAPTPSTEPQAVLESQVSTDVSAASTDQDQAATLVAGAEEVQPSSHAPRLPESLVEAGITRIRVPFDGDLTAMRSTIWADPAALAIDLPRGSTSLEEGRYPIGEGGVTDLRVNRSAKSLLLRMRLAAPIARYTIRAEHGVLEAQLQRARVSHAAH